MPLQITQEDAYYGAVSRNIANRQLLTGTLVAGSWQSAMAWFRDERHLAMCHSNASLSKPLRYGHFDFRPKTIMSRFSTPAPLYNIQDHGTSPDGDGAFYGKKHTTTSVASRPSDDVDRAILIFQTSQPFLNTTSGSVTSRLSTSTTHCRARARDRTHGPAFTGAS